MALKDIKDAIQAFIENPQPTVLAISGDWGTGKTFIWQQKIKDCPPWGPKSLTLSPKKFYKYSYVSASNCTSLEDLKAEILSFTVRNQKAGKHPNACQTFWRNGKATIPCSTIVALLLTFLYLYLFSGFINEKNSLGKFLVGGAIGSFFGALCQLSFNFWQQTSLDLALKDSIICIDDIERAEAINPHDILHYAAWLRDERNCKVALLLNSDRIEEKEGNNPSKLPEFKSIEHSRKRSASKDIALFYLNIEQPKEKNLPKITFQDTLEKGTNQFLKLNLTPEEAIPIWLDIEAKKDDLSPLSREKVNIFIEMLQQVEMNNIRVIEHLATALKRWHLFLQNTNIKADNGIWKNICLATVVTGCGYFMPKKYPSWEKIQDQFKEEQKAYFDKIFNGNNSFQSNERTKSNDFPDDSKENYTLIKNLFSENFTSPISLTEENLSFYQENLANIKNGYLSTHKVHSYLENQKHLEEDKNFQTLIRKPFQLMYETDTNENILPELRETFKKILSIPKEKYKDIPIYYTGQIIRIAKGINETLFAESFLKKYMKKMVEFPQSYFVDDTASVNTLQWIENVSSELWSLFIKLHKKKQSTDTEEKKFISALLDKYLRTPVPNISLHEWIEILNNYRPVEQGIIFNEMYKHKNREDIQVTFKNLCNLLKILTHGHSDEAILFSLRYEDTLKKYKESAEFQQSSDNVTLFFLLEDYGRHGYYLYHYLYSK